MLIYLYFQIRSWSSSSCPPSRGCGRSGARPPRPSGNDLDVLAPRRRPILAPSFIGGMLLLFTNAFSARATTRR